MGVRECTLKIVNTKVAMVLLLLCLFPPLSFSQDVKPGHDHVKEHHMHVYWFQNNEQQTEEALRLRDLLVGEVAAKQLLVVLNGVTSYIWPGLDDSKVPNFNMEPIGPHPCGSYEVHPLGKTELMDHTRDAMWLGPSFPIDTSILDTTGGDDPQYPELGLGYSA